MSICMDKAKSGSLDLLNSDAVSLSPTPFCLAYSRAMAYALSCSPPLSHSSLAHSLIHSSALSLFRSQVLFSFALTTLLIKFAKKLSSSTWYMGAATRAAIADMRGRANV